MAIKVTNGLDLLKTSILQAVMHPLASDPSTPAAGQIWYRSDLGQLSYWNGATNIRLGASVGGADILAALLGVDGPGSGLDADTLDGVQGSSYALAANVTTEISAAIDTLIGGASAAFDTLLELQTAIEGNDTDITAILAAQAGKTTKFSADVGNGADTVIAVTHNLGTTDVLVQAFLVGTGELVICDVVRTSINVVTLTFATAPTSAQYRVTVVG